MGEVVVVGPGDGRAGWDFDGSRPEHVAGRKVDLVGPDRGAGRRAPARAAGEQRQAQQPDGQHSPRGVHQAVAGRALSASCRWTAPTNTSTNATRSSTSEMVCANRNTV